MAPRHTKIVDRAFSRLKLRQLQLLLAVDRHGTIQGAARELGVSQPAATKMIKDLEIDFEVNLFRRTNRGVVPTAHGKTLIRHGQLIFTQLSNAAQEMDDISEGASGRVAVGTSLVAAPSLIPNAIERLLKDRPKVVIKITEGTNKVLIPMLVSGEIDIVVGRLASRWHQDGIIQRKLLVEKMVAVVGPQHPLATEKSISFRQLKRFDWILPPPETTLRRQLDQYFMTQAQFAPSYSVESASYLANRLLLQQRDLIGLMPAHAASPDIESGQLRQLNWTVPFGEGPIGVSFRSEDGFSPAGRAFLQALRQA